MLSLGSQPHVYAEGILNVCKLYVESLIVCVSGVTGWDIKKRSWRTPAWLIRTATWRYRAWNLPEK